MTTTLEIVAALAIAMVCNDMPATRCALAALDPCMPPKEIGELLARLDQVRTPSQAPGARAAQVRMA